MNNVLSLRPGDRLPDFALPGLDGKLPKFIWSFTGAPVIPAIETSPLDTGQSQACSACTRTAVVPVVVAGNAVAAAAAPWAKLGGTSEAPLLLCDADRKFLGALLAQGGMGLGPAGALRMRVIVLDPNQRVAATFDSRALSAAAEAMEGLAGSLRSDGGRELLLKTPMAPVLVLPRVFEPDFCSSSCAVARGPKDSGVSSRTAPSTWIT